MRGMTRRQILIGGVAGTATLAAGRAWAQQKELVANTYGGGWEQGHRQAIAEPLEKKTGAKVILISMLANELVARVKAAGGTRPPVDVALVDDGPFLTAIKEDVFLKLPMDKIPNAAKLYPQYRPKEPYGVPIAASVIGIAYNAKKLKTAPASWEDLWKPEYKGKVGLCTPASTRMMSADAWAWASRSRPIGERLRRGDTASLFPAHDAKGHPASGGWRRPVAIVPE